MSPVSARPTSLMRRISGRYGRSDRGASAVIFAVLLSTGVLLGVGAIVVDVGQLYAKRQEVLTGADSAVLAAAKDCVEAGSCTADGLTADPQSPTNVAVASSSPDLLADARITCGRKAGVEIRVPCDPPSTNLAGCIGPRPANGNYVELTATARFRQKSGSGTLLPAPFTEAIMGSHYKGSTLTACARERWGTPARVKAIGLGLSQCMLTAPHGALTGNPTFAPKPPYGWDVFFWGIGMFKVLQINYYPNLLNLLFPKPDCGQGPADGTRTGGNIAWLGGLNTCYTTFTTGGDVAGIPADASGEKLGCPLDAVFNGVTAANQTVLMPVYDTVRWDGSTKALLYHVVGFVSFYPVAFQLPISTNWHLLSIPGNLLKIVSCVLATTIGSGDCLMGFFTRAQIKGQVSDTSGTDYGLTAFNLTG